MELQNKVAVVTGASRGIGKSIAIKLAELGADVVVNYAGSEEKANEVVSTIEALGKRAVSFQCDVSNSESVREMMEFVIKEFGRIDILVNNAGITRDGLLMRMKDQDFDDVIDINLKGVFLTTKAVTRQMMKQKGGRIINISSIVGVMGNAGQSNYVAAKAGVIGLTKSTARELSSRGITVNAIAPGFIQTDMTNQLSEDVKNAMLKQIPLGRFGAPEDVANMVGFLAGEQAGYMTGQTFHIDGGMVM